MSGPNLFLWLGICLSTTLASIGTQSSAQPVASVEGSQVVLKNNSCQLTLDAKDGSIVALTPGPVSLHGKWFEIVEEDRAGFLHWETWKKGVETVFSGGPASVKISTENNTATAWFTYVRPSGLEIIAEVCLAENDAGPRWKLTVNNPNGAALVDTIRLPVLRGVELGDKEDDWITWPHTLGTKFRMQGFKPGQKLQQAYPDFMYMQWLDLHDKNAGVYVGCLDDYGYCKELFIGRDDAGQSLMGIEFTGCWIAKAGDSWTTPYVQIAAHAGDWRAGADIYRAFAEKAFGPLDPPERVREMPTAQCWLAHHASDGDLGKLFEIQQQAPIHASYLMKSLNTSIPEGWDGFRGSALEYEKSFKRIRELGGSPALFTFDRAPLMGRPNYADYVGKWTNRHRDGSFSEAFRDMMPAPFDPDLVRARVGEAVRWVENFGLDEIHFDTAATTGMSMSGPCYASPLGIRPNEVPHYFKKLYRAIRDACREKNPDFILRAEHCADFFYPEFLTSTAHFFEAGNIVAWFNPPVDAQMLPILFRYTLPRHAALQMPSMSDSDFWNFGFGMGHGFHGGGPSWSFNPGVREAETPPGELMTRYRYYESDWRKYYDFRVGFEEAVVDAQWSDIIAQAQIDGAWQGCDYPGPVIAVTHCGGGREVTLGQWYAQSLTPNFGAKFVKGDRPAPRPIRLRVPTKIQQPQVRLWGPEGQVVIQPQISDGMVEVDVPDPTYFALEVFSGPAISLTPPEVAHPGEIANITLQIQQSEPVAGIVEIQLPVGWPQINSINIPAKNDLQINLAVDIPEEIFGRNYPIKAIFKTENLQRTVATHLRVMDPVSVLYGFDTLRNGKPAGINCVTPNEPACLTLTCVNNGQQAAEFAVTIDGQQVKETYQTKLAGLPLSDLDNLQSPLRKWLEEGKAAPDYAMIKRFDFNCTGVPDKPVQISVKQNNTEVFRVDAWPRTRLLDLNGQWQAQLTATSRTQVGGAERNDSLDTSAVTPEIWDGNWEIITTPLRLSDEARKDKAWGIYRRYVYIPQEWQGSDIWIRLGQMGAPWGHGGTLNLVYLNGWPCGRIGDSGECVVSPFMVFGGWNLIAVASCWPNSLVEPSLFIRNAPDPSRIKSIPAQEPPAGAFIELGQRSTGKGLTLPFIKGMPEGDHRRTDLATGGENSFIYFAVADEFLREPKSGHVEVEVEYFDKGTEAFEIAYDSNDTTAPINGAFKSSEPCLRTDTGQWKTHVFSLPDVRFANRQHQGADFRLYGDKQDLHVQRVSVRLVPAAAAL